MPKKIPPETKEEIIRLYDNGRGLNPLEIVRQTGVSYSSVYGLTRARQRMAQIIACSLKVETNGFMQSTYIRSDGRLGGRGGDVSSWTQRDPAYFQLPDFITNQQKVSELLQQ